MCGISGIFNINGAPVDEQKLIKMNELIHHRGPDGQGVFVDNNLGIGSNRLAIIDLRKIADQPMYDASGRYVIVYNGEIFNYVEVRAELVAKGYKFNNNSDTEVILNAYIEYGENCLEKLNGMWSFAIWDKQERKLFCSRDRYGIKPFYYYKDNNIFIFGSEIKQLLYLGVPKIPDEEIIYDYLVFNFIDHTEKCFFKNIYKLPAGHYINASDKTFEVKRWYNLSTEKDNHTESKQLISKFGEMLHDSVRLRLRSDVEVGSCLSGGLDSTSIVCLMHDILKEENKTANQKTYTACYDDKEIDERKYVEEVIKQTSSTKYYLFPDSNELLEDFDKLVYHQDEPFNSSSIFSQWCVFKKIHETKIKVVLDGQGSDEILLGYFSFFPFFLKRRMINPISFLNEYFRGIATSQLGFSKFSANFAYFNTPFIRYKHVKNEALKVINQDFLNSFDRKGLFHRMNGAKNLEINRLANLWNISLPSLLRYEDKNSSAFSVEARLPFLDHRLVELIFSLPFQLLIKNGWTKYILRESMKNKIPDDIRLRKGKLAFSVPQKRWFGEIKQNVENTFGDGFVSSRYLDRSGVNNLLHGSIGNDKLLFRAYALERWMRVFEIR
ncbi:MAG: asparagine synthase (glutamine-hydrolyzing) [Ignavibacteria bacterium]